LRRLRRREERAEAVGVGEVARRRVGASRIRWIFEVGWAVWRDERVVVRSLWVEVGEAEVRWVMFGG
jgi:hypothetical protein